MSIVRGGPGSTGIWFESGVTKNEVRLIALDVPEGWYRLTANAAMYVYIDDPIGASTPILLNPSEAETFEIEGPTSFYCTAESTTGDVSLARIRRPLT